MSFWLSPTSLIERGGGAHYEGSNLPWCAVTQVLWIVIIAVGHSIYQLSSIFSILCTLKEWALLICLLQELLIGDVLLAKDVSLDIQESDVPALSVPSDAKKQTASHVCTHCSKAFKRKSKLVRHERSHTGERPYSCSHCEYRCSQKGHLKQHLLTHTGNKPFPCDVCGKSFRYKNALKLHKRTHTGERPYSCPHCEFTCARKDHLQAHIRTHTGEKPFSCDSCGKSFPTSTQLKRHNLTHTSEKPFSCDTCGKMFARVSDRNRHSKHHCSSAAAIKIQ